MLRVMDDYTEEQRLLVATAVEQARLDKQWSKEEAARHAGISSITWKRVEDGLRVQVTKLRAIEIALGWGGGSMDRVARGRPVVVADGDDIQQIRSRGWADPDDQAIWEGFRAATQYAQDCGARGATPQLVSDFIGDAVALLNEVGRIRAHPESSSLRQQTTEGDEHNGSTDEETETQKTDTPGVTRYVTGVTPSPPKPPAGSPLPESLPPAQSD